MKSATLKPYNLSDFEKEKHNLGNFGYFSLQSWLEYSSSLQVSRQTFAIIDMRQFFDAKYRGMKEKVRKRNYTKRNERLEDGNHR